MPGTRGGGNGAVASAVVEADDVAPARLLARGATGARGFIGAGGEWAAWIGRAKSIEVRGETGAGVQRDRFERVRLEANAVLDSAIPAERPEPEDGGLRFYGGFSFWPMGPAGNSGGVWDGFHAASFILPEVEARVEEGRFTLRVNRPVPADADFFAARQAAEAEAHRLREVLSHDPQGGRDPDPARRTGAGDRSASAGSQVLRREMPEAAWKESVRRALARISGDEFTKAVLARTLDITAPGAIHPLDVLLRFREAEPASHVFLFQPAPNTAFLGASPEVLSTVSGGRFRATAVAGSAPRGEDPASDERLGQQLRTSAKERAEQRIVHQEMARELHALAGRIEVDPEPRLLKLARIQHLETSIAARLGSGVGILEVLAALHPTPAVSGHPRASALEFLREEEPFERGWYGAPVGWFGPGGDGAFVPGLRSLVGGGREWRLFAGAGIVDGSDPDREWRETRMKFDPALRALGLPSHG